MSYYGRGRGPVARVKMKIVKVRLTFGTHTKDTVSKCQNVKVSDTAGPLCVKVSKKRSSLVSMLVGRSVKFWGALRPVSKFRPRRGPCVKSPQKRSLLVSMFLARRCVSKP